MARSVRMFEFVLLLTWLLASKTGLCHPYHGKYARGSRHKSHNHQALSKIAIHRTIIRLDPNISITVSPSLMGLKGESMSFVLVQFRRPNGASESDWIGVFSPAKFNGSLCTSDKYGTNRDFQPFLCTSPIKYQYANFSSLDYVEKGEGSLNIRLINQRADFAFALFTGGIENPVLLGVSNTIAFVNPKAPLYPRLALTANWDEMSVTWTSGYSLGEAIPMVSWGHGAENHHLISPARTLSIDHSDMCGSPARTIGWRDPGYIHTALFTNLWPNTKYIYKVGHKLKNGSYVWGKNFYFTSAPSPGQDSLQRVIIYGDLGKGERDGSNEYNNFQPGSLNTTDRLVEELDSFDLIFHIGDLCYANGYLSQWDQFMEQIESLASQVPYMVARYSLDYGLFHFCIADSEHDWREGTEQYKFVEDCLASSDRLKQPWLIFAAHRVLGYSSDEWYGIEGTFSEPMARENLQKLWQKYKVDLAFFGHVHNYERTYPVYESNCVSTEGSHYSGNFNATIHIVVGGAGATLSPYSTIQTSWSAFKDLNHGFGKLTAFNRSVLLFEYKRSSDGKVYDSIWINREYKDVLGCDTINNCPLSTLAS
eukprot:c21990_g1_i1 orf=205-1986(+)